MKFRVCCRYVSWSFILLLGLIFILLWSKVFVMNPNWIFTWILGYLYSLGLGHIATKRFLGSIRKCTGCQGENWDEYKEYAKEFSEAKDAKSNLTYEEPKPNDIALPPGLQGILERAFFTTVVALNIPGAIIAMMTWLAVKMLTNLNRGDLPPKKIVRLRALTGLQGSLMSMFFAFIGGQICQIGV